jgi:hypothetical protein
MTIIDRVEVTWDLLTNLTDHLKMYNHLLLYLELPKIHTLVFQDHKEALT